MGSRERKRQHWLSHIERWQDSGLNQAQYSRQHGLSASSFGYFLNRYAPELVEAPAREEPALLIPIEVAPDSEAGATAEYTAVCQALTLPTPRGFKVELPSGFDLAGLKQLIQVLEAA